MYRCRECGRRVEEPVYEEVCFEDYYGVGHEFAIRTYGVITTCPYCGAHIDTQEDFDYEENEA